MEEGSEEIYELPGAPIKEEQSDASTSSVLPVISESKKVSRKAIQTKKESGFNLLPDLKASKIQQIPTAPPVPQNLFSKPIDTTNSNILDSQKLQSQTFETQQIQKAPPPKPAAPVFQQQMISKSLKTEDQKNTLQLSSIFQNKNAVSAPAKFENDDEEVAGFGDLFDGGYAKVPSKANVDTDFYQKSRGKGGKSTELKLKSVKEEKQKEKEKEKEKRKDKKEEKRTLNEPIILSLHHLLKCKSFFPLSTFFRYLVDNSKSQIKQLTFSGLESTTDLAFYLIYKYFNDKTMWSALETVELESCRYVTDFGIDILKQVTGNKSILVPKTCAGCVKLFKSLHLQDDEVKDIFLSKSFTKCLNQDKERNLFEYKLVIFNDTNINMTKLLNSNAIETRSDKTFVFEYETISLEKEQPQPKKSKKKAAVEEVVETFYLNTIEVSSKLPVDFRTPYSVVSICFDADKNLVQNIYNKLMNILNENMDYISIILVINGNIKEINIEKVKNEVEIELKNAVEVLSTVEDKLMANLENITFQEQENCRNVVRLKHSIKTFMATLQESNYFQIVVLDSSDSSTNNTFKKVLLEKVHKRIKPQEYESMELFFRKKRYDKKVIKLEDFIDDLYGFDEVEYKRLIQTNSEFSTFAEDYLKFKHLLGECLYVKLESGDSVVVFDVEWFFAVTNKFHKEFITEFKYDSINNMYYLPSNSFKDVKFIEEFTKLNLSDTLQIEVVFEILRNLNLVQKVENEKENFDRYMFYFPLIMEDNISKSIESIWPETVENCLQAYSKYEFYFPLPYEVFVQITSAFTLLPTTCHLSKTCMIFQEGCLTIFLKLSESNRKLVLSTRVTDLCGFMLEKGGHTGVNTLSKCFLSLFNEYRIVVERFLMKCEIPYKYSQDCDDGFKSFGKIFCNFDHRIITSMVNRPEDFFVSSHEFRAVVHSRYELIKDMMKCVSCNISSRWFQLTNESYRALFPCVESEKLWSLKVTIGSAIMTSIEPERKSVASIFENQNETIVFEGTEQMSLFGFNSFKMTFASTTEADSIKLGAVLIQNVQEQLNCKRYIVTLNAKTRRVVVLEDDLIVRNDDGKYEYIVAPNSESEATIVRTQRYIKEYSTKLIKLPINALAENQIKIELQEAKSKLLDEIKRFNPENLATTKNKIATPERWIIKSGDTLEMKMNPKPNNCCDFVFYYNNEKIGSWSINNIYDYKVNPYVHIKEGSAKVFFNLNSSVVKSLIANDYCYKVGMLLEAEDPRNNIIIAPARINAIDEKNYRLEIKFEGWNIKSWRDAWSPALHPCGYWEYIQKEIYGNTSLQNPTKHNNLERFDPPKNYNKPFVWSEYIKERPGRIPMPFMLFTDEQKEQMALLKKSKNKYFPAYKPNESILSCDFIYNPRKIWNSLSQIKTNEITMLYTKIGSIDINSETTQKKENLKKLPALVLLPSTLNKAFIDYPNLNSLQNETNLNLSCIHRHNIKIQGEPYTTICYPHLLDGTGLKLNSSKIKLDYKYSYMILATSLDLANSITDPLYPNPPKSITDENIDRKIISDSLKSYFKQLSNLIAMMLPLFYTVKYRFSAIPFRQLLTDEMVQHFDSITLENNDDEPKAIIKDIQSGLEEFLKQKIDEFNIDSNGTCKYCNALSVNLLADQATTKSSDKRFLHEIIDKCSVYSQIVTNVCLVDNFQFKLDTFNQILQPLSISLDNEFFNRLPNVHSLAIDGIKVSQIDESIKQCMLLKNIEFVNNNIVEIPTAVEMITPLKQLVIENNPINQIPSFVFQIESLRSLILSKLNVTSLPDNWLTNDGVYIRSLTISQTRISDLPYDLLANNKCLEQLIFQGVYLILPENEQNWPQLFISLEKLIAAYCPVLFTTEQVIGLFKRFDYDKNMVLNYQEIQHLNAYIFDHFQRLGSNLTSIDSDPYGGIPINLFQCTALTYLDLSFQAIRKVPDAIDALKALKVLKLKYCLFLEILSASVGYLPLTELDLTGCINLKTPPPEIQRYGLISILAYLKRLRSGSVECKRTKLMLVGLGGAGKTSLVNSLLDTVFQNASHIIPTVTDGIYIRDWCIPLEDSGTLVFSCWDFAGQTVYYNTHQFFLTNRSIYLLVWNVRSGAEHAGLEFWLSSIQCHAPNCPILVVGTHIDLVTKYDLPTATLKKRFPSIVGFFFVSSYDGANINVLAGEIIRAALEEKYMGEKIPECWLQLEDKLKIMKLERNIIEYEEIVKIGMESGIFNTNELNQSVQFLHDLGSLLYFNNEFLKNKIVINPQYIVDLMACLVSINNTYVNDGKLYHSDIGNIWKDYDVSLHSWIIKLTEKFDLTFNIQEKHMNLVPCLMSETPPDTFEWPSVDTSESNHKEVIVFYEFEYLPSGLFNRAQVRLYQISDNTAIWKNGSLLKKNKHLALLQRVKNQIELRVQGIQPENVLFLIHEVFEVLITESFNGARYDFTFPCPDCIDINAIDPEKSMFKSSLVRRASEMKAPFLQCRQHFHAVSLVELYARFPPDNIDNYDLQFRYSIRDLKHLKQCLSSDVSIIYSVKDNDDENIVHPRKIKTDLESAGYICWFSEEPGSMRFDSLVLLFRKSTVVLFCMSDNFINDKFCIDSFNYVKSILKKPYVLLTLGESDNWKKHQVGALVSHEYYVKINTIERYTFRLPELLEQIQKKITETERVKRKKNKAQCFISYCHSNSKEAVSKGTPLKNPYCLGHYDPRSLKAQLEKLGYTVWIDYEDAGSRATLFEDIVEGIRQSKVVIACISNEYALSDSCMKEFRFSTNLKKPIILCLFGSEQANCDWKVSELGIMSCLNTKEINFKYNNANALDELVKELKNNKLEPVKSKNEKDEEEEEESIECNETETAYHELFEVTQRKFLRQMANVSDSLGKPFPRLFILDLNEQINESPKSDNQTDKSPSSVAISPSNASVSKSRKRVTIARGASLDEKSRPICIKALCEHEYGWHVCGNTVIYETFSNIPVSHYAYLIRLMTLVKHSKFLNLNILYEPELLEEFLVAMQEKLQPFTNSDGYSALPQYGSSTLTPSRTTVTTDLKESFNQFKNYVERKLPKSTTNENQNSIDYFDLNRCIMPSGKLLWLCPEHRKDDSIQVLTTNFVTITNQYQSDEFVSILFNQIKKNRDENSNKNTSADKISLN